MSRSSSATAANATCDRLHSMSLARRAQPSWARPRRCHDVRGFSLLELLIVLVVAAIIASVAIPAYQDRTIRARLAEGDYFANSARTALSIACQEGNLASKTDNALLGLASPTAYGETSKVVKSIAAAGLSDTSGQVTITFRAVGLAPEGAQIVYRGECGSSGITWTVTTGGGFPPKYQPRT